MTGKDFMEIAKIKMIIIAVICICAFFVYRPHDYVVTVLSTEINQYEMDEEHYLVHTRLENGDLKTFENSGENSSEIEARLHTGDKYRIEVTGLRVPALYWFENIEEIKEAS